MAQTQVLVALIFSVFLIAISHAARSAPSPSKLKAVNLGGWLVTEGWIKPSLFDAIPNNDLLDGTQVQFKSVTQGMYLCAENGGGTSMVANRASASGWETFKLWRISASVFNMKVFNGEFIGIGEESDDAVAVANEPGDTETFEIVRSSRDFSRVRIKASNGLFLQAKTDISVAADYVEDYELGRR